MGRKLNLEAIKSEFERRGCLLLEKNIVSFRQSLRYLCVCGRESSTRIDRFRETNKCKYCVIDSQRTNFDIVKLEFQKAGFTLLASDYKNANQRLDYICSSGHKSKISLSKLKKGQRCKKCADEKQKYSYEQVKAEYEKLGCRLIETTWIGSSHPMRYICSCGKEDILDWSHFRISKQCRECSYEKISKGMIGSNNSQWKPDREKVAYLKIVTKLYRESLHRVLRYLNKDKHIGKLSDRIEKDLGYNWQDFKKHISEHPNHKKFSSKKWHIDHIFPLMAFFEYNITDIKIINSLDNLQPLPYDMNIAKKDKYDRKEFEKWLHDRGVSFVSPL